MHFKERVVLDVLKQLKSLEDCVKGVCSLHRLGEHNQLKLLQVWSLVPNHLHQPFRC